MASHNNSENAPDINTGYPGHIYNFDPETQTCEVQLAIENLFIGYASAYTIVPKQRLTNVPVKFTQGGSWSLTHPVPDGTPCYVHFAQRGIDHWVANNSPTAGMVRGKPAPAFSQLFSHNAAVAEVGYQPIPKAIGNFNPDVMELRNADRSQRVTLDSNTVTIIFGGAKVVVTKDSTVEIEAASSIVAKAPNIKLDGIVTVTKALIGQGGMSVSGGSGAAMSVTGNVAMNGTVTVSGKAINGHTHTNPEGGNVGPF